MSFKKKKYTIIKEAISKELALFLYNYILIKRQVAETMFKHQYISPIELSWGHWTDNQVPNTYSHYADVAMETLLLRLNPLMEKATGLKLYPNYSYCRVYKKGDILKRHIDRFSCEISTTMNLGGNEWPIFLLINKKEVKQLVSYCHEIGLDLVGLMCIPPANIDPENYFDEMNKLNKGLGFTELSMGMSSDFLLATKYLSTYLRVGSSIFGQRS